MKNKNVTAVEWLQDKLKETYNKEGKLPLAYTLDLIKQAKQMEKSQVSEAWNDGNLLGRNGNVSLNYSTGEQYYKEIYRN